MRSNSGAQFKLLLVFAVILNNIDKRELVQVPAAAAAIIVLMATISQHSVARTRRAEQQQRRMIETNHLSKLVCHTTVCCNLRPLACKGSQIYYVDRRQSTQTLAGYCWKAVCAELSWGEWNPKEREKERRDNDVWHKLVRKWHFALLEPQQQKQIRS